MSPLLCRVFAGLTLLLASAVCLAAEPLALNVPTAGVPTPDSSLDQFILSAKRQAETGTPEFKQLVSQLDPLRAKQQALLATRRTKEAEVARLQSAGGDTKRIALLQQEIDVCSSQLNAVDTQFQVLMYRIQPGPKPLPAGPLPASRAPVPIAGLASPSGGPVALSSSLVSASGGPVAVPSPTSGPLTRTVSPDKIKVAADALARSPAPSAAAARNAATQILSASQSGFANAEVEQLARVILDLASQTNTAELHAELNAGKPGTEKKSDASAPNPASNEIKFEIRVSSSGDQQSRVEELQARQAKLQQATIELMRKPGGVPDVTAPVKK